MENRAIFGNIFRGCTCRREQGGGGNVRGNLANRGIREDKIAVFQYFVSATDRKARISG